MLGTTVGDSLQPLIVGFLMKYTGNETFTYCVLGNTVVICSLYVAVHFISLAYLNAKDGTGEESDEEQQQQNDGGEEESKDNSNHSPSNGDSKRTGGFSFTSTSRKTSVGFGRFSR